MEERHGREQFGGGRAGSRVAWSSLAVLGLSVMALGAALGCEPPQPPRAATPAAQAQGAERLMASYPPLAFVDPGDAVVRLLGTSNVSCTGTLVADDIVLTAHHCVAARDKKGRALSRDLSPEEVTIELGGDELPWGEVKVRAIVAPRCGYVSGEGDIALLVLERHLVGMPTSLARIESPPAVRETVNFSGFGRCALSSGGIKRREQARESSIDAVAPGHFEANAPICPGDSGGPVYSGPAINNGRKEIIGVISASVMDGDEKTRGRSLFTRLDLWASLFAAAYEISNGVSPSELPPYGDCRAVPPPPAGR